MVGFGSGHWKKLGACSYMWKKLSVEEFFIPSNNAYIHNQAFTVLHMGIYLWSTLQVLNFIYKGQRFS